jgi:hypothetical protein
MMNSPRLRAQKEKRPTTVLAENADKPDTFYLDVCPDARETEANLK